MLFSMDKPCGPWLRDRPTIAILWRIRNDVVHAYMMAAECGRWDALVLDTHLEISLPTANKASARHSGLRSDARQTSQRIPLDETAKSQVSLELSWQADEGIRLKVVISHHNNLPSRSSTVGSDHEPPRSPDVLSRTSSVRYRHNGRVLTRLNGTIIRTAVPRELAAPVLFTIKINNQHQRLNLFNGRIVTLVGTLMSTAIEQLVGGQDGTCLLSPGIHSGDITGFMIFSICSASNNMPLDRHPCLIIAWRVTAHGLPQILVHTMHILPNQAAMLVESEMAERFFTGLENQLIESETLQRLIKLNTQDSLSLAVYMRKGKEGEVTGLEVLATAEPIPPAALASMMVNNANQSSGPELECGKMETKSITPPSSSNNNNSSNSSSSNSEADKETSVEESSTEKESTNDSVQMESSTSTSSCGVQPVVITPDASPTQTFEDNAQDGMDRSTLTGTTTPNNITATSTAVPTPVMTPTSGPEIANDPCPALSLPMATTLTEGSVTETQLTLMVANIGTQARLQFFAAYPLDVVGSGLSNPIIESGEQAIIILQETLDPSLSSSQPMDTVIAAPLSGMHQQISPRL
ncbi:hypothetical protein BDF22DRAFT_252960 [Syncephalis plumigaleata]|nr:hypothetical protein BDF22DRAFT_252960 [Syncephalis plumigaleata]